MLEESVESFITSWRAFATSAQLFARAEGNPLLELRVNGTIFSVLERTNPYLAYPGQAQVILHAVAATVEKSAKGAPHLEVIGQSKLAGMGEIRALEGNLIALDVGFPLILGSLSALPATLAEGSSLSFSTLPPVHGFVLQRTPEAGLVRIDSEI